MKDRLPDRSGAPARTARGRPARSRALRTALVAIAVVTVTLMLAPEALAQTGNDVGHNLGQLLRQYAGEIYAGVVAIVSLVFLLNRRYTELATFVLAAVVVGWMVFSPDQVARLARDLGNQILP
jgi:hypothetical protein